MRFAVILFVGLAGTNSFSSPVTPDPAVVEEIKITIDSRAAAEDKVNRFKAAAIAIEKEIGVRDKDGRLHPTDAWMSTVYAKRLLGLGDEKYEEYARATQEYKRAQDEFKSLTTKAINQAMRAYQIVPAKSSGIIVSGPPKPMTENDVPGYIGNHAVYNPVFISRMPVGRSGETNDAGQILIGPDAFSSPGKLAFTLYHEGEHFERLLTPGLDLRIIPDEEARSRERQRPLLKQRFGLNDEEIARFDEVLKSEKVRAEKWKELIGKGLDPYKKSMQPAFPGGYRSLWLENGEVAEVNVILDRAKEIRGRERDAQLSRTISDLALRSCDAPGGVSQEELNALPRPHEADYISRNPYPLDVRPCVAKVYEYLGKGGMNASEVARLALPPAKPIDLVPLPPVPHARPALSIGELELLGMRVASIHACASSAQGVNRVLRSMNWANFQRARSVEACAESLSGCELRVFRGLVQFGREWRSGMTLSVDAVMAAAAEPGYTQPSSGPVRSTPPPDPCYHNELGHRICPE